MKAVKKAGTIVISVLLWIVILIAALYAFTTMATRDNQNVSSLLGYTPLVVKTNSMSPTFDAGDLIFIKKCDPDTLKEGDIICFHTIIDNEYALNTHRIEKIDESNGVRSYTTMGDNNNGIADRHIISNGDIVGKYTGHLKKSRKGDGFPFQQHRISDRHCHPDASVLYLSGIQPDHDLHPSEEGHGC